MSRPGRRAVVIGAGLGGIACGIRLAARGLDVTVLEQEAVIGGRAAQIREAGYTFDVGPSLITMPWVLEELFTAAGQDLHQAVRLRPLDPFYRIAWHGESRSFLFNGDRSAMLEQIGQFSWADAARYDGFLAASRAIYEQAIVVAGRSSFLRLADFLALVPAMLRLGALRSVDAFVGRFFQESHVRQAFGFHPLFIGGDPFRVPAVYAALAYLQIEQGVWYAEGGVHALIQALGNLLRAVGGRIETGSRVKRILTAGNRVRGVQLEGGEELAADLVVSNADAVTTATDLLGRPRPRLRSTMGCYLLYLGTRRSYPQLQHHTLLVGADYRGFITDVTRRERLSDDISVYVHAPARTDPGMATTGGESLAVLLPVPNLRAGLDWQCTSTELRERLLNELESPAGLGLTGLRSDIAFEAAWTPLDFRDRLGAVDGNAFAAEPTLRQSAYFRTPNRDRQLSNLYYAGGGTHPGAGIPGVLLGAEVTSNLINSDLGL
ncbi:MAG: phytoene desaturase family protein [Candidatus Dormibacteraeota bacterium]|nr:phytoene desaturase family protein [Candidatus Dormibacteraeota bacterium]